MRATTGELMTSGRVLTLIGADGTGKSTQAERLCTHSGSPAVRIYMGSNPSAVTHALPSTRAWTWMKRVLGRKVHHAGPPEIEPARRPRRLLGRGLLHLKSLAMLGLRASEDTYRLLIAKAYARRGYLVVMDRHPYPDYHARRVRDEHARSSGRWVRWGDRLYGFFLERVYPHPSDLILLDAPAEVLYARKQEGSLAALRARRREYLDMIEALPDVQVTVVDVTRGDDEVLADLLRLAQGPRRAH